MVAGVVLDLVMSHHQMLILLMRCLCERAINFPSLFRNEL